MELPHYLLADCTDNPDCIYIIHTEYPRFVWEVNSDEVEWLDQLEGESEDLINEVAELMSAAEAFYMREMQRHEEDMDLEPA